ncbi:MAG: SOUL family heme-binding protein [Bacteroidia bacterium]
MKVLVVIVGVVLLVFLIVQVFAMSSRNKIEEYAYTVVKKYENFEVRNYESGLFTSVKMPTNNYQQASSAGFRVLAGYIFGGNSKQQKIAMTSPVAMTLEDSMTMMFMVPKDLSKKDLPEPNSSDITFKEEPQKTVAAITFGGWANDANTSKS